MARGFGATYGVATTDRIDSTLATDSVQRSYAIWAWRNGTGTQRLFATGAPGDQRAFAFANTVYEFDAEWTTAGQWTIAQPAAAQWHHVVITYDGGAASNTPSMYLDGVSQSVTPIVPTGTRSANTNPYLIGNRAGSDRVWDGLLADFAVWDRLLTADEITALAAGLRAGGFPTGLVEWIPMDDSPVTSHVRSNPTVTGTAVQADPVGLAYPGQPRVVLQPYIPA